MFCVPEGEKLYLWTEARHALQLARLFMTSEEMAVLHLSTSLYNQRVDELFDEKITEGWKLTGDDERVFREIENAASLWVEENVPGYLEAFTKLDNLFMSSFANNDSAV